MGGGMANIYLGMSEDLLRSKGAIYTAREIAGQPDLWKKTLDYFVDHRAELQRFIHTCFVKSDLEVILTGAGTSAFIGDVLEGPFQQKTGHSTRAVATTDLVTHADQYFFPKKPVLLISFARSGNSPESVAAVDLANQLCENIYHLIITCNPSGALAQKCNRDNCYVFFLPPDADDQSLAMTGSFTSMLLVGSLLAEIDKLDEEAEIVNQLIRSGNDLLSTHLESIKEISELPFKRAVFLGSGPMQGISCESHLKLQELSDGNIVCKFDSFLGFRHGPKAVIDSDTLIVFQFSNNSYVRKYERDLVMAINRGERGLARVGIGERIDSDLNLDYTFSFNNSEISLPEEYLAIVSVLPAQMLGFFKSLNLGLKPDTPSESGTITRVVEGVEIYPFTKNKNTDATVEV
jgi:tagatose-6-phosphate ketose/aldose isomerase